MSDLDRFTKLKVQVGSIEKNIVALEQDKKNYNERKKEIISQIELLGVDPRKIDEEINKRKLRLDKLEKEVSQILSLVEKDESL